MFVSNSLGMTRRLKRWRGRGGGGVVARTVRATKKSANGCCVGLTSMYLEHRMCERVGKWRLCRPGCWGLHILVAFFTLPVGKRVIKVGFVSVGQVGGQRRHAVFTPASSNKCAVKWARWVRSLCLFVADVSRIAFGYFVLSDENQSRPRPSLPCLRLPCFINVSPQYCPLSYTSNLLSLSFWM